MATRNQIEANRRNAKKSTGPRTSAGKRNSSANAIKHGLTAEPGRVLAQEDPAERARLEAGLMDYWEPQGEQELLLVRQITDAAWRMQRAGRFEDSFFDLEMQMRSRLDGDHAIAAAISDPRTEPAFRTLDRYTARAASMYFRAIAELRRLQSIRREKDPAISNNRQQVNPESASFGQPAPQLVRPLSFPGKPGSQIPRHESHCPAHPLPQAA